MLKLDKLILAAFVTALAYGAWPLHSAKQIRDAVVAGDTYTLARKIEWVEVRKSLKDSISAETIARLEADPDAPKPGMWQRIKAVVTPKLADTVIDRYVTPENLPSLFGYHKVYRGKVRPALGLPEPRTALAGTWLDGTSLDRFASFWTRVRRAVFHSLTRFEIEVEDKYHPERRYTGMLELKWFEWKLTRLTVTGGGF